MIRSISGFNFFKSLPRKWEPVAISQKVISTRFFIESTTGKGKKRPLFNKDEENPTPDYGSVQSHLSWGEGEREEVKTQKEQGIENTVDSKFRRQLKNPAKQQNKTSGGKQLTHLPCGLEQAR